MKNAMVARLLDVVLATGLLTVPVSSSADTKRTGSRTPHSRIAVGPQYDTTHAHLTSGRWCGRPRLRAQACTVHARTVPACGLCARGLAVRPPCGGR
ncbi:hypothetical protein ABZ746_06405 [Streptomyces sp. NPDC020096]